jgi:hypothetical protein
MSGEESFGGAIGIQSTCIPKFVGSNPAGFE